MDDETKARIKEIYGAEPANRTEDERNKLMDWAWALRSGRYQQGHSRLVTPGQASEFLDFTTPDKHCCLGVVCELVGVPREYDPAAGLGYLIEDRFIATFLPEAMYHTLGLAYDDQSYFIALNDTYDATFKEIADRIEEMVRLDYRIRVR